MGEGQVVDARPTRPPWPRLIARALLLLLLVVHAAGWLAAWTRNPAQPVGPIASALYVLGQALAVLAPLLWAGAVLWLARSERARLLWLLAGVLVLAPIPLLVDVA
ncbi:MAG: hypothetical protein JWP66_1330 [Naasia sp.]|nr:hypothetical protein [Naasia sp.]